MLKKRLLYKRSDNHYIYSKVLPYVEQFNYAEVKLIKRRYFQVSSDYWLVRFVIQMISDFANSVQLVSCKEKKIFIREFSGYNYLFLIPLLLYSKCVQGKEVMVNVNHNLNGVFERKYLLPLLRFFCRVVFIEPSDEIAKLFPWLTKLTLKKGVKKPLLTKNSSICVFVGRRAEQQLIDLDEYLVRLSLNFRQKVAIYGKYLSKDIAVDNYLSDVGLISCMRNGVIVLLYKPEVYMYRHSGFCLQAIIEYAYIFLPSNSLFGHYAQKFDNVFVYDSYMHLEERLKELVESFRNSK